VTTRNTPRSRRAFSLVELVIVVVIIGILSAIAVPRMSASAENAAASAVIASRDALQRAVDLYTIEHEGALPHESAGTIKTFYFRLLKTTDLDGTVNDASGIYGPYINGIPMNPINAKADIRIGGAAAGANTHGWRYDTASGEIQPDHTAGTRAFKGTGQSVEKVTDDLIQKVGG
jgi:general secretion pathway protein G